MTEISLGMSVDISVTATCKGVEDTSVAQIDMCVTTDWSFECTSIDKFCLGNVLVVCSISGNTFIQAVQVDVSAETLIILICSVALLHADGTMFTTTEYLEHVTVGMVNGGAAPYLGVHTIATAKHVECLTQHVHSLFVKYDTGVTRCNIIAVACVQLGFTILKFYFVEHVITVDNRLCDGNDDITIDATAVIAPAVDVTILQTTVKVIFSAGA